MADFRRARRPMVDIIRFASTLKTGAQTVTELHAHMQCFVSASISRSLIHKWLLELQRHGAADVVGHRGSALLWAWIAPW